MAKVKTLTYSVYSEREPEDKSVQVEMACSSVVNSLTMVQCHYENDTAYHFSYYPLYVCLCCGKLFSDQRVSRVPVVALVMYS